jgi:hypothetical protein
MENQNYSVNLNFSYPTPVLTVSNATLAGNLANSQTYSNNIVSGFRDANRIVTISHGLNQQQQQNLANQRLSDRPNNIQPQASSLTQPISNVSDRYVNRAHLNNNNNNQDIHIYLPLAADGQPISIENLVQAINDNIRLRSDRHTNAQHFPSQNSAYLSGDRGSNNGPQLTGNSNAQHFLNERSVHLSGRPASNTGPQLIGQSNDQHFPNERSVHLSGRPASNTGPQLIGQSNQHFPNERSVHLSNHPASNNGPQLASFGGDRPPSEEVKPNDTNSTLDTRRIESNYSSGNSSARGSRNSVENATELLKKMALLNKQAELLYTLAKQLEKVKASSQNCTYEVKELISRCEEAINKHIDAFFRDERIITVNRPRGSVSFSFDGNSAPDFDFLIATIVVLAQIVDRGAGNNQTNLRQ